MKKLMAMNGAPCACGKSHQFSAQVVSGAGAIARLPEFIGKFNAKRVYLLSDRNTWVAAGEKVQDLITKSGISCVSHCFREENLEPDERAVGSAVMHFDWNCDLVVAVGSGVINDIGKCVAAMAKLPYIIVGTAPSMDGYASATSSMTRDGLKISLNTKGADVIIGDTDILCQAPLHMMKSGLGDIIAKYVSICEWRLAHLIVGEYYCPEIADLIRQVLKLCVDRADGLLRREKEAVQAVFEGLVISGVAMNYAGLSRPASGVEHYISHCLDMRYVEYGTAMDLHGIQCAVGTRIAIGLYEKVAAITPNREKALACAAGFDYEAWSKELRHMLGKGADSMIALEKKEKKYDLDSHAKRLEVILAHWEEILQIIREELPSYETITALLERIDAPKTLAEIGTSEELLPAIFACTKDIRDKYVLSRLCWDLGIGDELFD
jgi:glycerol-1-phosphate dehydrogenase [NAD(P)+]